MREVDQRLRNNGVVPVIKIENPMRAVGLGNAIMAGGIDVAEVTFRTTAAPQAIRAIADAVPDLLVGAGTVLTIAEARLALESGARFIVSPGYDDELAAWCIERDVPFYPGVCTPSEITSALRKGLSTLKLFPAEASGGCALIDALAGPFPSVRLMPTGGIDAHNLETYIRRPSVLACGGSWMVRSELVESEQWDEITRLCREAVAKVHGFSFAHLGINPDEDSSCTTIAQSLGRMLQPIEEGPFSIFASPAIEIIRSRGKGTHGHIGIRTWDIERALHYLGRFGLEADFSTERRDGTGRPRLVYLHGEIAGFAVHLVRG